LGAFLGHILGATALPLAMSVAIVGCLALIVWALTRNIRVR
jgi:nitrate reductase NapE component